MKSVSAQLRLWAAAAALGALGASARATFSYAFIFGDPPSITKVGDASYNGNEVLTNAADQHGAFWYSTKQKVSTGFFTTFRFHIDPGTITGDGFAFVLQDDPAGVNAIGGGGSTLGYGAGVDIHGAYHQITHALAVEFDTFSFGAPYEFPTPHVSIQSNGVFPLVDSDGASLAHADLAAMGIDILDYRDHTGHIQYSPAAGATPAHLDVYIDERFVLTANVDLTTIGGTGITDANGEMYVGFTGSTGLADSTHQIFSWAFNDNVDGACDAPYWSLLSWGGGGGAGGSYFSNIQVVGQRPMTFRWYQYGSEITDNRGGRVHGLGTDTLEIYPMQFSDYGYYYVSFQNACGQSEGIRVHLGECIADVDDGTSTGTPDGGVTIDDLLFYLVIFDAGDIRADVDDGSGFGFGDGGVTIDDLLYYLARFDLGC